MMNKTLLVCTILLVLTGSSCKEIYTPKLDNESGLLVVDGKINDQAGPYTVHLYRSAALYSSNYTEETGAQVYVNGDPGEYYYFTEKSPGNYYSDSTFRTQYYHSYNLEIFSGGNHYESTWQAIYPSNKLNTITAFLKTSSAIGNPTGITNLKGVEFLALLNTQNDFSPYYRFDNTLLIEYTTQSGTTNSYCWLSYNPNETFNLSTENTSVSSLEQVLGFCPVDTSFYGINMTAGPPLTFRYLSAFKFTIRQYHINADVYKYYQSINNQLAAKQQILDPAIYQCIGNITCLSNPEEPVLGAFEASSVNTYSFYYTPQNIPVNINDRVPIDSIGPLNVTSSNCSAVPPDFW